MSDTPQGETATTEALKNEANPTPAPQANVVDPAEVERLRKAAEQAQIRANQLENELKKTREAEEAAKLKQLEENNEWKSVAEQNRAKLEALEAEREAEARSKELSSATKEVFSEYPPAVQELATELGVGLADTTDEAREALKTKLEGIKAKVGVTDKVTPNNPNNVVDPAVNREEVLTRMKYGDKQARESVISALPGVDAMRKQAGWSE